MDAVGPVKPPPAWNRDAARNLTKLFAFFFSHPPIQVYPTSSA